MCTMTGGVILMEKVNIILGPPGAEERGLNPSQTVDGMGYRDRRE